MENRDDDRSDGQARVPFERDYGDALEIQCADCGGKQHQQKGENTPVHNQRQSQDQRESDVVDHVIVRLLYLTSMDVWRKCR